MSVLLSIRTCRAIELAFIIARLECDGLDNNTLKKDKMRDSASARHSSREAAKGRGHF